MNIANAIYKLLTSICENNIENQRITSKYLPYFIVHSFYLSPAFTTVSTILANNAEFLLKLLDNVKEINDEQSPGLRLKLSTKMGSDDNKQTIEHISSNLKAYLKQMELIKAEYEEKHKISFVNFIDFYNKCTLDVNTASQSPKQDLINFYTNNCMNAVYSHQNRLKRMSKIKNNLFYFFNKVCLIGQTGVNANQEIIFKIMIQEFWTLDFILLQIENDENRLVITIENQKRELKDLFQKNYGSKKSLASSPKNKREVTSSPKNKKESPSSKKGSAILKKMSSPKKENKKLSFFHKLIKKDKENENEKESLLEESGKEENIQEIEMIALKDSSQKITKGDFIKLIQKNLISQLDFFSNMCNGRNYTWKTYLESIISYNSLIKYLDSEIDLGEFIFYIFSNKRIFF